MRKTRLRVAAVVRLGAIGLVVWMTLASCSTAVREDAVSKEIVAPKTVEGTYPTTPQFAPGEAPFGAHLTLREYLKKLLSNQYYSLSSLYSPPPDGFESLHYMQLTPENAVLYLAQDVVLSQIDEGGVAVALSSGVVQVWSNWPCPGVALPDKNSPSLLSFFPASPYLAVFENVSRKLRVYDLRLCGEIYRVEMEGTAVSMALSPNGLWLALVDEAHALWIGPSKGPLKTVDRKLRYRNLAIAFAPQDGVLMAVDQAGWVTLWAPHTGKLLDHFLIQGGPFTEASFQGVRLELKGSDGAVQSWDLSKRVAVYTEGIQSPFHLEQGVLYYKTQEKHLLRKMHLGRPQLRVWHSPDAGILRVRDFDGKERFYSVRDGSQIAPVNMAQWLPIEWGRGYLFSLGGNSYRVADLVYQQGSKQLYCRHVPGEGFYLWWEIDAEQRDFNPHPGQLPVRDNLRGDASLVWEHLVGQGTLQ